MKSNFKNIGEMFKYHEQWVHANTEVEEIIISIKNEITQLLENKKQEKQEQYNIYCKEIGMNTEDVTTLMDEIAKSNPKLDPIVARETVFGEWQSYNTLLKELKGAK